jgi:hypothetical protein
MKSKISEHQYQSVYLKQTETETVVANVCRENSISARLISSEEQVDMRNGARI